MQRKNYRQHWFGKMQGEVQNPKSVILLSHKSFIFPFFVI